MQMHKPSHPGTILAYYMGEHSVTEVAKRIGVTRPALSRVLHGKAGVSADMALRLADAFGTEPDLWLRLQMQRDLWEASQKKRPRVEPFHRAPQLSSPSHDRIAAELRTIERL